MPSPEYRPVLILGNAPRISVPIARSLHRHGTPVEVASFSSEEPIVRSRTIRNFHRLPDCHQASKFLTALTALIKELGSDMLIPTGDAALAAMARHYADLSSLVHMGCPSPHIVERVLNKALTLDAGRRCGIAVPSTFSLSSPAELDRIAADLTFPVVVKPRERGARSFKVLYFNNHSQLSAALPALGPVLLQEYCPGVGVGVEMLMHRGTCVAHFQHRRLKEAPASGGVAVMAISEDPDPQLMESSLALLRDLEWDGPAMVEFRLDPATRRPVLMEVNGRYWGTTSLPIQAGIDFPLYHWQLFHGEEPHVPETYAIGMRWRWTAGYFDRLQEIMAGQGDVGSRFSRGKELLRVPLDFSPTIRDSLWSFSDPRPALADLAETSYKWAGAYAKWLANKLLPKSWKSDFDNYRRLGPVAGPIYARLRMLDRLHLGWANRRKVPPQSRSFIFICHGNIMRSPMAEAFMKRALVEHGKDGFSVISAGLHAKSGREAHPWALAIARELGFPLQYHRAQPLTAEAVSQADAIFAMDFQNKAELLARFPEAELKIFMLSAYARGSQRGREIPDPYFGDEDTVRRCYALLQDCIQNLVHSVYPQSDTAHLQADAARL